MRSVLIGLFSLIGSSFFVQFSNAAITTMVAIVVAESGGSQSDVAMIASAYAIGFIAGCFLFPPQIARIGLIRAYAAAAGIMTVAIIAIEILDGVFAWTLLRFAMGASFAAVMAISDAWINDKAPGDQRGKIIAVYSTILGLASIASQILFFALDATEDGFVLIFAISMNLAVVMVVLGTSQPPDMDQKASSYFKPPTFVSTPATVAAFVAGFSTTSLISIVPFYLTDHGVEENLVAGTIAFLYLGRLFCQWPIGLYSDRLDRRIILIALSTVVLVVMNLSALIGEGEGLVLGGEEGFILQAITFFAFFILGGTLWPMYSVASALAFDRADGRPMIDISTTLLVVNSLGAVVGPIAVMMTINLMGDYALHACVSVMCVTTVVVCLLGMHQKDAAENPTSVITPMSESSIEMTRAVAELVEEQAVESEKS